MFPRLNWATALPWSAARRYHCHRLGVILRHAPALGVHTPEIELGDGIALVRSAAIPLQRLGVVLRHALALVVHIPEIELGVGIALHSAAICSLQNFAIFPLHSTFR